MNSLAYLSRQFDVVASRTPPSTPTTDRHSYNPDRRRNTASETPLPRVKTWSTKSFLFSPQSRPGTPAKRSHSSPSDFISIAKQAARSLPDEPAPSTPELQVMPKDVDNLHSLLKRIFFVRVLSLAWDALQTAWMSLTGWYPVNGKVAVPVTVREKEVTDDETTDESLPPSPLHLSPQQIPQPQTVHRSFTDPLAQGHKPLISPQDVPGSRASTPGAPPRRTPFHLPKTLVLDLDETLIHSTSRPMPSSSTGSGFFGLGALTRQKQGPGHVVEVVLGGRSTLYHVYKRPFVDFFLRTVSGWYTLVIFTASMQEYADPVIDWLDQGRGILTNRLFRDSCTQLPNGTYTKDLSVVENDLARVCLIDNSPVSYRVNEANGIPIEGWTHDPSDEALLDLLPVLDSLRFTSDVRRVLGLRCAGGSS
ncbi:NIF-domain-containing protein [Hymenopellis radicata]|nr:NIF-domain-containing protein [Hymenopellis radicata]